MFENIIGQDKITAQLSSEIATAVLPSSLLFYGPQFSGKLSTALETARILTCDRKTALWNCPCKSCEMQRLLIHPYTVMLGPRYFDQEIAASAEVLLRTEKEFARYLFIRSVRKLVRRFDPFLWEGEESKVQKVQPLIQSVEDAVEALSPGRALPEGKKLKKLLSATADDCKKIAAVMASDNIPIHQIRRVTYWAHISSPGERKVIILERADRMQENSRNALLKILEEPPEGVFFILISENRSSIMPTILSRVRSYFFPQRSESSSAEVLQKIFREDPHEYGTLRRYFLAWKGINPSMLENVAERFVSAVAVEDGGDPEETDGMNILDETAKALLSLSDAHAFQYFLEEISFLLRKILRGSFPRIQPGQIGAEKLEYWNSCIYDASRNSEQFHISASLLLESLYYRMKGLA